MSGMGNIREVVHTKQLEVLQLLGNALEEEELELQQLQKNLLEARQLVNRALTAENSGADAGSAEAQSPSENPADTTTEDNLEERIRRRAAEIFVEHGCEEGHAVEQWLQAEAEVLAAAGLSQSENTEVEVVAAAANPASEIVTETATTENLEEKIRRRAAEIFAERGGEQGHAVEDWLQAEAEILGRPPRTEERRKCSMRSGADRRVACLGAPTGNERRHGEERRKADRRQSAHRVAVVAGGV